MADSVVKLKVNSQEYDQKIQRAAQGLRAFIEDCRKSGQSLTEVSGETMQFVQNLGKMPTVAENGVKSIREYTKASLISPFSSAHYPTKRRSRHSDRHFPPVSSNSPNAQVWRRTR